MKTLLLFLMTALVIPAELAAQPEPKAKPPIAPVATPGENAPAMARMRVTGVACVGAPAPAFELLDANGRRVKLSQYRGDRVVLAFADRGQDLSDLGAAADTLRTAGVRLVGICRESPRRLRTVADRHTLRFDLLADDTGEIAAMYGVYDFTTSTIQPGYLLVDPSGIVRMVVLGSLPPGDVVQITRYDLAGWERTP